jgi:hypothetical protein
MRAHANCDGDFALEAKKNNQPPLSCFLNYDSLSTSLSLSLSPATLPLPTPQVLRGGARVSLSATVQDLHAITPASFLECGESVFHDLSYHQARNHATPVANQGVYVCQAGYMLRQAGVAAGSLVQSVNGVATPTLAAFEAALASLEDGALVPIRVRHVTNRHQSALTMLRVDRTWFPTQRVDRLEVSSLKQTANAAGVEAAVEGGAGDWAAIDLPAPSPSAVVAAAATAAVATVAAFSATLAAAGTADSAGFDFVDAAATGVAATTAATAAGRSTRFPPGANAAEKAVAQSLVQAS